MRMRYWLVFGDDIDPYVLKTRKYIPLIRAKRNQVRRWKEITSFEYELFILYKKGDLKTLRGLEVK